MAKAAAFFDLDKTVLAKSSTLAFAKPLYKSGLLGRGDVLKSAYGQFVYLVAGADAKQMDQMRAYMSALISGWPVDQVKAIITETLAEVIEPIVYSEALDLFDEHHAAGRDVIVVSSSGTEVIEPICARLGVDKAIGTQVEVIDGKYTGEILFYCYGPGKAEAIEGIAKDEGYDLAQSYAYSDSYTDLPMLEVVGHPVATNPDKELRAYAREHDWEVIDFEKPVAMRTRDSETRRAAAAGAGAAGAVALGLAWYARYRRART